MELQSSRVSKSIEVKQYITLFFLSCFLIFQQGCTFLSRTVISAPDAIGVNESPRRMFQAKAVTTIGGPYRDVQFETPDLDIAIQGQNAQPVILSFGVWIFPVIPWPLGFIDLFRLPRDASPPLLFEILLRPKIDGITFDPTAISLETSDRVRLLPSGFWGPFYESRNYLRWPCDWYQEMDSPLKTSIEAPMIIDRWTCVRVAFDINSSPDQSFSFSINGIRKRGEAFSVPAVRFKKGISWEFFSIF